MMPYRLVFVVLWQDVLLPLVQSQTFDQAQSQSETRGENKPQSVEVWVLTPLRYCIDRQSRNQIARLRRRCPGIVIRLIPEVNRLNDFPSGLVSRWHAQGNLPIVFHFRGEASLLKFAVQYQRRNVDRFVVDVRGYWPAEFLFQHGFEESAQAPENLRQTHDRFKSDLVKALQMADGIVTVSENLKTLLHELAGSEKPSHVIPCCVRSLADRSHRDRIRQELQVGVEERLLVYSGGYARYQHLEDLTIPLFKQLLADPQVRVLIISQDMQRIEAIVNQIAPELRSRFIFKSVPQEEVAKLLTACDLGFLIRKETLVNKVAQPVKVGEYLSAGVPVCVEGEVGGVTDLLLSKDAGVSIRISGVEDWSFEVLRILEFLNEQHSSQAAELASLVFLWPKAVERQRRLYLLSLQNSLVKNAL